jgi:hypothetical protein
MVIIIFWPIGLLVAYKAIKEHFILAVSPFSLTIYNLPNLHGITYIILYIYILR